MPQTLRFGFLSNNAGVCVFDEDLMRCWYNGYETFPGFEGFGLHVYMKSKLFDVTCVYVKDLEDYMLAGSPPPPLPRSQQ
jgi:hypothetical protein